MPADVQSSKESSKEKFYGPWVIASCFLTFGLSTGFPYYNIVFFYDYFSKPVAEQGYGWSIPEITLGFPLAALLTLWVGPLVVPRFSPRKMIIVGTGLTCLAFQGFAMMDGSLITYYGVWILYVVGYIISGPIPHQIIISNWYRQKRGRAMGVTYVGVAVIASIGSYIAPELVKGMDYKTTLQIMGAFLLLAWPVAFFLISDHPSEKGQLPDGEQTESEAVAREAAEPAKKFSDLLGRKTFWLLLVGSACSIGAIGAVNAHMKLIFGDQGFVDQEARNAIWRVASMCMLWASIFGRLGVGWAADRFSRKRVMLLTYVLVAGTIPLLLLVTPDQTYFVYIFALLFGFGMGADYMLIPLMAADQFGLTSLGRAMSLILPGDTIGQTWFPRWLAQLKGAVAGGYGTALWAVFGVAMIGATAIGLLPGQKGADKASGETG